MKKKILSMGMSKHTLVLLLSLTLIISSFLPLQVKAFDKDTHFYLKYYLLCLAGFSHKDAETIARADVSVDSSPGTSNLKDWHACGTPAENQARRDYLKQRAMNQAREANKPGATARDRELALIYFGQFLHFLEDMYSHVCPWYLPYWLFAIIDHVLSGHRPDYLSSYSEEQLQAMIKDWLGYMKEFFKALTGQDANDLDWSSIWEDIKKIRDCNPSPKFWNGPDPTPVKEKVEDYTGMARCTFVLPEPYNYDKDGNPIAFVPMGKFGLEESEWLIAYNSTVYDIIDVIESSPWLENYPDAEVAVELLQQSMNELKYPDPPIDTLGDAISNLIGLSHEDEGVMNVTTNLSLSMLYLVFMRDYHVTYIALLKGVRGRADFNATLFEAYGEIENVEAEIQKMETDPYNVDFGYLASSLTKAWEHLREAEQLALQVVPLPITGTIANITEVCSFVQLYNGEMKLNGKPAMINYTLHVRNEGNQGMTVLVGLKRTNIVGEYYYPIIRTIYMEPGEEYTDLVSWYEGNWTISEDDWTISLCVSANEVVNEIYHPSLVRTRIWKVDIDGNGKVDILDISTAAKTFGSKLDEPKWDSRADINNDKTINILDLSAIASNFGKMFTDVFRL